MATKAQVKAACKRTGVQLSEEGYSIIALDAPYGKIFDSTITHYITYDSEIGDRMSDLWAAALSDIEFGIVDCKTENCEICESNDLKPEAITYYKHRPSACRAARRAEASDGGSYKVIQDSELGYFIKKQVS